MPFWRAHGAAAAGCVLGACMCSAMQGFALCKGNLYGARAAHRARCLERPLQTCAPSACMAGQSNKLAWEIGSPLQAPPWHGQFPVMLASIHHRNDRGIEPRLRLLLTRPAVYTDCVLRGRFVKFQCVHALSVFIEDNQGGGETTRVLKVALLGQPAEKMDVAAIKKAGEEEA